MAIHLYKTYALCPGPAYTYPGALGPEILAYATQVTFNGLRNANGTYAAAPGWFSSLNTFPVAVSWVVYGGAVPTAGATYQLSYTVVLNGTPTEYLIEVEMNATCAQTISTCQNPTVLAWLTREGGWQQFSFNGHTTYNTTIPAGVKYQTPHGPQRWAARQGVYQGEALSTGRITAQAVEVLESLKYAVQAYYIQGWNTPAPQQIPIIVKPEDFIKRKTGDRFFDVKLTFTYATELNIQTQ